MIALPLMLALASAPNIIGGEEVAPGEPVARVAVLIQGKIGRASFTCSGALYAPDLVVTAQHCLGGNGWADLTVYFRTRMQGAGPGARVIGRRAMREGPSPSTDYDWDDIALVRLESPAPLGYEPATLLDDASLLKPGAVATLAGYGRDVPLPPSSGDGGVGVLRQVDQKILQSPFGRDAVLVDLSGGKGACNGDSGGPAFVKKDGRLMLFGVTSRLTEKDRLPDSGRMPQYGCTVDMVYENLLAHSAWLKAAAEDLRRNPDKSLLSWSSP